MFLSINEFKVHIRRLIIELKLDFKEIELGISRQGKVINAFQISCMPFEAIFLGYPHPNEPLCQIVLDNIIQLSKQEESDVNNKHWIIIPVWDIDGAEINQEWWTTNISIPKMIQSWYRPSPGMQVEWTFPLKHESYSFTKILPETEAIKNIIDEVDPDMLISLHNGFISDPYLLVSNDLRILSQKLTQIIKREKFNQNSFCPIPYVETYSPGIYGLPYARNELDYLLKYSNISQLDFYENGASSFEYVKSSCTSIVLELPFLKWESRVIPNLTKKKLATKKLFFWNLFQKEIIKFFSKKDIDQTNILLSSPYYFFRRSSIDTKMLNEIFESDMNNEQNIESNDLKSYFNILFTISTQYSQLFRGAGYSGQGYQMVLNEIRNYIENIEPMNQQSIINLSWSLLTQIINWKKEKRTRNEK